MLLTQADNERQFSRSAASVGWTTYCLRRIGRSRRALVHRKKIPVPYQMPLRPRRMS